MRGSMKRLWWLSALALTAMMAVGVATAGAHRGGPGDRGPGGLGGSTSRLVTEAAKQLDVTRAKLVEAIEKAAVSRIDEAVEDGDVDADDAAELKEEAGDNLSLAMAISRTRTVASNLGVTTAKLNTEFREARRGADPRPHQRSTRGRGHHAGSRRPSSRKSSRTPSCPATR